MGKLKKKKNPVKNDQQQATWIQVTDWLLPLQSALGQYVSDHLSLSIVTHEVQAGADDSCSYK
jgi:hypothetical protein